MHHPIITWTEFPSFAYEGNFIIIASILLLVWWVIQPFLLRFKSCSKRLFRYDFIDLCNSLSMVSLTKNWIWGRKRGQWPCEWQNSISSNLIYYNINIKKWYCTLVMSVVRKLINDKIRTFFNILTSNVIFFFINGEIFLWILSCLFESITRLIMEILCVAYLY